MGRFPRSHRPRAAGTVEAKPERKARWARARRLHRLGRKYRGYARLSADTVIDWGHGHVARHGRNRQRVRSAVPEELRPPARVPREGGAEARALGDGELGGTARPSQAAAVLDRRMCSSAHPAPALRDGGGEAVAQGALGALRQDCAARSQAPPSRLQDERRSRRCRVLQSAAAHSHPHGYASPRAKCSSQISRTRPNMVCCCAVKSATA